MTDKTNKTISELFNIVDEYTESIILKELGELTAPVKIETIVKNYGIQVFKNKMGDSESGAIIINDDSSGIVVNSDESLTRQRFTIAHEFGHFISYKLQGKTGEIVEFRDGMSSLGTNMEEVFANKFASAILMPKKLLLNMLEVVDDIGKLAHLFDVSKKSVENRLKNLIIS